MLRYFFGFLIFLLLMAAAYYFIGLPPSTIEEKKTEATPIVLGFVGPLSGNLISVKNSVELAVGDLKTQGKNINVFYEDGKCGGDEARVALTKLINEQKVRVVIGGVCSGETLAMAPLVEEKSVVLLSPSASSPEITKAGTFVFRNNPSDTSAGRVLGKFLTDQYKNLIIVSENNEFSQNLRLVFLENYKGDGKNILVDEVLPDTEDAKELKPIITKIKEAKKSEAVLIAAQSEVLAGTLVKEMAAAKINLPLFIHLLPTGSKFLETAGKAAEGIIFTDLPSVNLNSARVLTFLEDYKKNYGLPAGGQEFYMAAAYDAVNILAQATEKVGSESVRIRDYLYSLSEFYGLIGKYSFDLNGDVVGVSWALKKIKDGRIENHPEEVVVTITTTATTTTSTTTQKR